VASWKGVRRIVAKLPETSEPTPHNWRVGKKLIVWERALRKADYQALGADAPSGDILGAWLAEIGEPDLTELITDAWLAQAPKTLVKRYLAG
jgi:hypothetical protein